MTKTLSQLQKVFFALGTANSITVYEPSAQSAQSALEAAKNRVLELHSSLNAFSENSEISAINRSAGKEPVRVSGEIFRLIEDSVKFSILTDGMFDITSRPLSQLWKTAIKQRTIPKGFDIINAALLCDWRDIILDGEKQTVMLRQSGQQLDMGAIAKGYVADEVKRTLLDFGVTNAIINLGGSVINLGEMRKIGLQNPFEKTGTPFGYLTLGEKAVVTSGVYEQCVTLNGKLYHHIINPKTGFPYDVKLTGVTLVGDNCEQLDALATSVMMMNPEKAVELLKVCAVEAVLVTKDRQILTTEGLKNNLRLLKEAG